MLYHVHTKASHDSMNSVSNIIKFCKKNDVNVLAITDHDSMGMISEARNLSLGMDLHIISSIEYSSYDGDIIGLFIDKKIESKNSTEIIHSIKDQGGIVVLPHPYKGHNLQNIPLDLIDVFEVFNPRCNSVENKAADDLRKNLKNRV